MTSPLDQVALLAPLSRDARESLLARGKLRSFVAGDRLLVQGEPADSLHVILTGRVRVDRAIGDADRSLELAELGMNEIVGEVGLLDGGPRTATVTALSDVETLELHRTVVALVLMQDPAVAGGLLQTLSRRLRSADELADQLSREGSASL